MAERKRNKEIHFYVGVLHCPVVYSIDIPEVCHTVSAHIQIFLLSSQLIQLLILLISCP